MCGRYTLAKKEKLKELLQGRFQIDFDEFSHIRLVPRFNVAPTQQVPVVLQEDGRRKLTPARWGLVPFWAKPGSKPLINARAETVATNGAFRDAFKSRRCLVPADGFYEWATTPMGKVPHHFTLKDDGLFAFAGIWEPMTTTDGAKVPTLSLITTTPNEMVATVHNRMPVILTPEREAAWLDGSTPPETLTSFLTPYPADRMKERAVSTRLNSAKVDSPDLLEPAASEEFRLES